MSRTYISELLNHGSDKLITTKQLESVTGLDQRTIFAEIERERREGRQILASKGTREKPRGFYLPKCQEETEAYLHGKANEIIKLLETNLSIKHGKRKALDAETISSVRALLY